MSSTHKHPHAACDCGEEASTPCYKCDAALCDECATEQTPPNLGQSVLMCSTCARFDDYEPTPARRPRKPRKPSERSKIRSLAEVVDAWWDDGVLLRLGVLEGRLLGRAIRGCSTEKEANQLLADALSLGEKRLRAAREVMR